jgi:hypothetical protein
LQLLPLVIFNKNIKVVCHHPRVYEIVRANFNIFTTRDNPLANTADLSYQVDFNESSSIYSLIIEPDIVLTTPFQGEFLYWIEKEITISLQKIRKDLYFLHAAALEYKGDAFILTGPTGSGKSTMTWALLNNNCSYLSDELAPIDIQTMSVQPYPHALCLKAEPASPYTLPADVIKTESTDHIPTTNRNIKVITQPTQLKAIFFVQHQAESSDPSIRKLKKAESALRLYTNTLNALAHDNAGLNSATAIVTNCACYELMTADLTASCAIVKRCLEAQEDFI